MVSRTLQGKFLPLTILLIHAGCASSGNEGKLGEIGQQLQPAADISRAFSGDMPARQLDGASPLRPTLSGRDLTAEGWIPIPGFSNRPQGRPLPPIITSRGDPISALGLEIPQERPRFDPITGTASDADPNRVMLTIP